ncbi:MAG: TetR/AcrR family transcriptional regulator [Eggerthellaceae bacterium]|nr:TetR/AcrR family transcriptional regulator [Eggerthellaceae bacterium]
MSGNFDTFHSLEPEKQQRIIKAALNEFGTKGFKRASTNAIAQEAQIGKGMLFYYFGSKEELFDFLCEYTIEFAKTEYVWGFSTDSGDFLERHKSLTELKRKALIEFPEVINFLNIFYREENAPRFKRFKDEIAQSREQLDRNLYGGLDYSLFRDDFDGKTVVTYLKWLLDSYENDITERLKREEFDPTDPADLTTEWERFYSFTKDLHHLFYKEEN